MLKPEVLENAEGFMLAFRCDKYKFLESMLKNGEFYFSCAEHWVEVGKQGINGQGDIDEGTFAKIKLSNIKEIESIKKNYKGNLNTRIDGDFAYFSLKGVLSLPAFCFYTLKNKDIPLIDTLELQDAEVRISEQYFREFAQDISEEQYTAMKKEERPAVIVFRDYDSIKCKMEREMKKMGIDKIEAHHITYHDMSKEFSVNEPHPGELFYKDCYFFGQHESRFIVKDKKFKLVNHEKGLIVKIGNIEPYAEIFEEYPFKGITLKFNGLQLSEKHKC